MRNVPVMWALSLIVCSAACGGGADDATGVVISSTGGVGGSDGNTGGLFLTGGSIASGGDSAVTTGGFAPADAIEFGPYDWTGSISSYLYNMHLAANHLTGLAWFDTHAGVPDEDESLPIVTGIISLPPDASVGSGWICPGPGATISLVPPEGVTSCFASECQYIIGLPAPSWLSCSGTGNGTLTIDAAVSGADVPVTSTEPDLAGTMQLTELDALFLTPGSEGTPNGIGYRDLGDGTSRREIKVIYTAEKVPVPDGQLATEWLLSDIYVLYYRDTEPTRIHCASAGVFHMSDSEPITQTVEITGLSDAAICPGTEAAPPMAILVTEP